MGIQRLQIYFSPLPHSPGAPQPADEVPFLALWPGTPMAPCTGAFVNPFGGDRGPALLSLLDWLAADYSRGDALAPDHAHLAELLAGCGLPPDEGGRARPISAIGERLFAALISANPEVARLWEQFEQAHAPPGHGEHRLILHFCPGARTEAAIRELMSLPWEAMSGGGSTRGPLGTGTSQLVIVRSYRRWPAPPPPADLDEPARILALGPPEGPSSTLRAHAAVARPDALAHADYEPWCLVVEPPPPGDRRAIEAAIGAGPAVLHYFGHGEFDAQDAFRFLLQSQAPGQELEGLNARRIWLTMAAQRLRLFVSWACRSGGVLAPADKGVRPAGLPVVPTLADEIPALLVMQTLVDAGVAATASAILYGRLATGEPLTAALYWLRRELYQHSTEVDQHPAEGLWWVPALYLREPDAAARFARRHRKPWRLHPGPDYGRLAIRRADLVEAVRRATAESPLVCLAQGPRGGKSRMLQILRQQLGEAGARIFCFGPPPSSPLPRRLYLAFVQRSVALELGGLAEPPDLAEEYQAALARADGRVYLLIDDGHRLDDADWEQLLPAGAPGPRVVASALVDELRGRLAAAPRIPIERHQQLSPAEAHRLVEQLQSDLAVLAAAHGRPASDFAASLLLGFDAALSPAALGELLNRLNYPADPTRNAQLLTQLVEQGYLYDQDDLGAGHVLAAEARYRASYHDLREPWRQRHTHTLGELRSAIRRWRQGLREADYSDDLLELLSDPAIGYEVEGGPGQRLGPSEQLQGWIEIARRYFRSGMIEAFQRLCERHSANAEVAELERALLQWLQEAMRADARAQEDHRSYLWLALGAPDDSPPAGRVLAWHIRSGAGAPYVDLIRVLQAARRPGASPALLELLIAFLEDQEPTQRAFMLRWIVVPCLLGDDERLAALLDTFPPASAEQVAALGEQIVAHYRESGPSPLVERVAGWLAELGPGAPIATVGPLALMLRAALAPVQRRAMARRILEQPAPERPPSLTAPPPLEPLVAALVAERDLKQERPPEWWHGGRPSYNEVALFAREMLAALAGRDSIEQLVERWQRFRERLEQHRLVTREAHHLLLIALAAVARGAALLDQRERFLELARRLPALPFDALVNLHDRHAIIWLVPLLLRLYNAQRLDLARKALHNLLNLTYLDAEPLGLVAAMLAENPNRPELFECCFDAQQALIRAAGRDARQADADEGRLPPLADRELHDWAQARGAGLAPGAAGPLREQIGAELERLVFTL